MDDARRAGYYTAAEDMYDLPTPDGFDWDKLEVVYLDDEEAGAKMLAEAAKIPEKQARKMLRAVYA